MVHLSRTVDRAKFLSLFDDVCEDFSRIWKDSFTPYFKILSSNYFDGAEENNEKN
jgi:hypothetical protein